MKYPELPTRGQRLAAARLAGVVRRLSYGSDRDTPLEQAVATLREITTDPVVLGHVLGTCLVHAETPGYAPAVEMLRAAGADEETAAVKAAWLRWRLARNAQGGLAL